MVSYIIIGVLIGIVLALLFTNKKQVTNFRKLIHISAQYLRGTHIIKSMNFVPESIVTLSDSGYIVYSNAEAQTKFGYKEEELEGERMSLIIPIGNLMDFENFKTLHINDGFGLEIDVIKSNKTIFPAEIKIGKWYDDEDKRIANYTVVIKDISHRRDTDEAVKLARSYIDKQCILSTKGLELLEGGSLAWDMANNKFEYDEGFRKIFKLKLGERYSMDDLINTIHFEDVAKLNAALLQTQKDKFSFDIDFRIGHKNNTKDLIKLKAEPKENKNGNVIAINGGILLLKKNVT